MNILLTTPIDSVAQIAFNRPEKRNAMDGLLIEECMTALQNLADDSNVRVVVIAGEGEHFCAGADIAWMRKISQASHAENIYDAAQLAKMLRMIKEFPKPMIGLVHGVTMGGGLGVIACCDIVIAADNSSFCFSEVKIGLTPSVISPYIVPVIGERATRYYFLTAEKFQAEEAKKIGLIQKIVAPEKLAQAGLALAETLLKNSPYALSEAKYLIDHITKEKISDELGQFTAEHLAMMRAKPDAQEGLQAFLDKRAAQWK